MTARASSAGRSPGSTAAMDRPNRIACPAHGTCSDRPSQRASPSVMASGVRLSETRVAIRSPAARPSGEPGPASSTTPVSIPPDPVTGFCILPRSATMPSTAARIAAAEPPVDSSSCRNDAASRFSRPTRTRTSSGQMAGPVSSCQAACGSTPAGLITRCRPSGEPAVRSCDPVTVSLPVEICYDSIFFCRKRILKDILRRTCCLEWRWSRGQPALRVPAGRACRAGLAALPGLVRGDHGRVGVRPVAARALREEPAPAAPR